METNLVSVSEFVDGQRVFRKVEAFSPGDVLNVGDLSGLEERWCQRVVDGLIPGYTHDAGRNPTSADLVKQLHFQTGTFTHPRAGLSVSTFTIEAQLSRRTAPAGGPT